jgi:hypothetical protein
MAADPHPHPEIIGAALDHAPGVDAVHRFFRQYASATGGRAEQGSLAVLTDAGGLDVGFEFVMRRHFVALAAFFVQAHPPGVIAESSRKSTLSATAVRHRLT